jgi:hypothetical protein
MIPLRAKIVAVVLAVAIFVFILNMVRRKKLKEEYSVLWVVLSALLVVLAAWSELLVRFTRLVGAQSSNSLIFFFGFVFVLLLLLSFTVRLSRASEENKEMAQRIALLQNEIDEIRRRKEPRIGGHSQSNGDAREDKE